MRRKNKTKQFYRREEEVESAVENIRVHGFSMAESLLRKKRGFSFSFWVLLLSQGMRGPHSGLPPIFN